MDRSEIVTLIAVNVTKDDYGVPRKTETSRNVFAQVDSVTRAEFFDGGRNGLNPEYKVTMFFGDYEGEPIIMIKGSPFSIYRTYYARTDVIELYCERKGGTNGAQSND